MTCRHDRRYHHRRHRFWCFQHRRLGIHRLDRSELALIHHRQGRGAEARALLEQIVSDYGDASPETVRRAQAYLDEHFR